VLSAEPTLNSEQLAGELNHSNNRTVDAPQAAPVILRDPVTNEPTTRSRGVFYADSSDGGRA
jgi:hypothetical protein